MEFVILVFIFVGIAIFSSIANSGKRKALTHDLLRELGLRKVPQDPSGRLTGNLAGYRVSVTPAEKGGEDSHPSTRIQIRYPRNLPAGVDISPEGIGAGLQKLLGTRDIETGDAAFDDMVLVKGLGEERVRAYLTPERRQEIMRWMQAHRSLRIRSYDMELSIPLRKSDPRTIADAVRGMIGLGAVLLGDSVPELPRRGRAVPPPVPKSTTMDRSKTVSRFPRNLSESRDEVLIPDPPTMPPPPSLDPAMEVEFVDPHDAEVDRRETLEPDPEPVDAPEMDEEPDLPRAEEPAAEPTVAIEPHPEPIPGQETEPEAAAPEGTAEPEPAPLTVERPAGVLDPEAVCVELFDPQRFTSETTRLFEEKYEGKEMMGSGRLDRVEEFPFDFVFGSQAGVKATVLVKRPNAAEVPVLLRLPAGTRSRFEPWVGRQVRFRGKLIKADAFMKRFFAGEGTVELI